MHFKYLTILDVNYTLIKLNKKENSVDQSYQAICFWGNVFKEAHEDFWFKEYKKAGNCNETIVRNMNVCSACLNSQETSQHFWVGMSPQILNSKNSFIDMHIYSYSPHGISDVHSSLNFIFLISFPPFSLNTFKKQIIFIILSCMFLKNDGNRIAIYSHKYAYFIAMPLWWFQGAKSKSIKKQLSFLINAL